MSGMHVVVAIPLAASSAIHIYAGSFLAVVVAGLVAAMVATVRGRPRLCVSSSSSCWQGWWSVRRS